MRSLRFEIWLTLLAAFALGEVPRSLASSGGIDVEISGDDVIQRGRPVTPKITIRNPTANPAPVKIDFVVQEDPDCFDGVAPDAIFGSDHARGAKSWTEADGTTIEEGSLTDGDDSTSASTEWNNAHWAEAFQYIDLEKERTVSHLAYVAGDANWVAKMDVAASADGKTYHDIAPLSGIDLYKKWGRQQIAVEQPFAARVIRFRYHKDGQRMDVVRMPATISVYDVIADESFEFPSAGRVVAKGEQSLNVAGKSEANVAIGDATPVDCGAYFVAAKVQSGGGTQMLYRHCFVMPSPLARTTASHFGINASRPELAPLLGKLGVGWVRFENMKWPMTSPKPGDFRFDGSVGPWNVNHDAIINAYRAQGLSVLPFLFETAGYASSAPLTIKEDRRWAYPPTDNATFAEFCFQTVARYGAKRHPAAELKTPDHLSGAGKVFTYEIWNEQNLTDPGWGPWVSTAPNYFEMFRAAAEAVKRADPTARVANGGIAGIEVSAVDEWSTFKYPDGKRPLDFADVLSVHYYSGREVPEQAVIDTNAHRDGQNAAEQLTYEDNLDRLIAWRDKNKKQIPIWLTETGYDTGGPAGMTERLQAARLPRCIMMALAAGIEKVFVYREQGSTPSFHACEGVIRDDGSLKPAYFTYATLIRQLDGMTNGWRIDYAADKNVRIYRWDTPRGPVLSCWAIRGTAKLKLGVGKCTMTDSFGGVESISGDLIPLTDFPAYLSGFESAKSLNALKAVSR